MNNTRNHRPPLAARHWNFDSVPDSELIACCYWEYARESIFLRKFKSRCEDAHRQLLPCHEAFELCGKDARLVLSIGPVADSFLLGFGLPSKPPSGPGANGSRPPSSVLLGLLPITGVFPAPWQALSPAERTYRAKLAAVYAPPEAQPFQRATGTDASNSLRYLASFHPAPPYEPVPLSIPRHTPHDSHPRPTTPATNQAPPPVPSVPTLLRLDTHSQIGDEIALVQIQWALFDDDQILDSFRAWLKANRPPTTRPLAARGHKPRDWRCQLTRLAVMRLLSHFSALQLVDAAASKLPELWQTKQFAGSSWLDVVKWHDARREARQVFHQLFPFLPLNQDPISWAPAPSKPVRS